MFFITRYINKDGKMVSIKEAAPVASEEDNVTTSQTATDNADTETDNAGDSANQQNTQTDDAFFTINGKKIFSTQLKWNYICAYIRLYWFSEISINYGKIPFVFDVSSLI